MARNSAELTVGFTSPEFPGLILERDDAVSLDGVSIRARLYPPVDALVATNYGSVRLTGELRQDTVLGEVIDLGGSERLSTKYPITSISEIRASEVIMELDDADGFIQANYDGNDFVYDAENDEIVSPAKLYGAIIVTYITSWRIINYEPLLTISLNGQNVSVIAGAIYAFYEGQTAILDIDLNVASGGQKAVLFRAISDIVADATLEPWEKPPNWPTSGEYPQGISDNSFPDPNASATRQRVHAIGYYNTFGEVFIDFETIPNEKPYATNTSYNPQVYVNFSAAPEPGLERGFTIALRGKDRILNTLEQRYSPNYLGEQ